MSPAAKICMDAADTCGPDETWGRLVDGSYYGGAAFETAAGLLRALRQAAREFERKHPPGRTRIEPRVVLISTDPWSTRLCDPPVEIPSSSYGAAITPLGVLWNAQSSRAGQARRALADAAAGFRRYTLDRDCFADGTRANTHEFMLGGLLEPQAVYTAGWAFPLGSTLWVGRALCRDVHVGAITAIRRELGISSPYECMASY
jgi:hypothetical protein